MKKLLTLFFVVLVLTLALASCGGREPKHEHIYGTDPVIEPPTCTEAGSETEYCPECGEWLRKRTLEPIGHRKEWVYSDDGTKLQFACTNCGEVYHEASQALEIAFDDYAKTCTVEGVGNCSDTDIVIPPTYGEYLVTKISDEAFKDCTSLTSITIPYSITEIGKYAFSGCTSLASVEFAENSTLTDIGYGAFENCTSLTNIVIPGSVRNISRGIFENCSSLVSVTLGSGIEQIDSGVFKNCTALSNITIPDTVTDFSDYVFENCTSLENVYYTGSIEDWLGIDFDSYNSTPMEYASNLYISGELVTSITIPESVTSIGYYAFYGCTSLTNISVDENNEYYKSIDGNLYNKDGTTLIQYAIGKEATTFTIPESVTGIDNLAFYGCTSLTTLVFSRNIPSYYYEFLSNLTTIILQDGVTNIPEYAFEYCTSLTSITIPDSVISIGYYSFDGCPIENATMPTTAIEDIPKDRLKTVVITSGTTIPENAFSGCTSLTGITIPDSVTNIGYRAFYNCTSLTSIDIPNSVTSIGGYAFSGCEFFASIEIPDGLTSIGEYAFEGCTSLTSITIPLSVTSIGYNAFKNCPIENADIPMAALSSISTTNLKTLVLTITDKDSISNKKFYGMTSLVSVIIQDGVTSIGTSAFENCTSLTSITIPDSVTTIGNYAFSGCTALVDVVIGDGVTSIGYYSFDGCPIENATMPTTAIQYIPKDRLKTVVITSGTTIPESAFVLATSLESVKIPYGVKYIEGWAFSNCYSLKSIEIPSSVYSIGKCAFQSCTSLESITIPSGVKTIGEYAFNGCLSLESITIPSGVKTIGEYAFQGCESLSTVYLPSTLTSVGKYVFWYSYYTVVYCEPGTSFYYWDSKWLIVNDLKDPDNPTEVVIIWLE